MLAFPQTLALAPPPLFERLLFEDPAALVATCILVGLVLLIHGNRRMNRRVMLGGVAAIALAGVFYALASLVVTTREHLKDRTREMIALTAPLDVPRFADILGPRVTLSGPGGDIWLHREQIVQQLEAAVKRYKVSDQSISDLTAETRGDSIGLTELSLRTTLDSEMGAMPITTRWLFAWAKQPDGKWRVNDVKWLLFQGNPPSNGVWR